MCFADRLRKVFQSCVRENRQPMAIGLFWRDLVNYLQAILRFETKKYIPIFREELVRKCANFF